MVLIPLFNTSDNIMSLMLLFDTGDNVMNETRLTTKMTYHNGCFS
jgi:hypothetical protein